MSVIVILLYNLKYIIKEGKILKNTSLQTRHKVQINSILEQVLPVKKIQTSLYANCYFD